MTVKPILFSAPMVLALLREAECPGTGKTTTRRILKQQPPEHIELSTTKDGRHIADDFNGPLRSFDVRFAVGDILYVREAWTHRGDGVWTIDNARMAGRSGVSYRAEQDIPGARYWPSIHMPKEFSRLTLEVIGVKVERLQDISEEDAIAEGLTPKHDGYITGVISPSEWSKSPVAAFKYLWNSLHGPDAWDANPWVVAPVFNVHRMNVDQYLEGLAA